MIGGGGGIDLDVITAAADDVLSGKVIVDKDGNPLTGILTLSGDAGIDDVLSGKTFYTADPKNKQTGTLALTGNAGAADVLSGKTFYTTNPKSKQTGTMGTMGGGTYTPKSSAQTISCSGKKMTGNIVINGANIYKMYYAWISGSNGSRTYTAANSSWSRTWSYKKLSLSGFKQICGICFMGSAFNFHSNGGSDWNVSYNGDSYYGKGSVSISAGSIDIPTQGEAGGLWVYGYAS